MQTPYHQLAIAILRAAEKHAKAENRWANFEMSAAEQEARWADYEEADHESRRTAKVCNEIEDALDDLDEWDMDTLRALRAEAA